MRDGPDPRLALAIVTAVAVGAFAPALAAGWAADDFLIVEGFLREHPGWRTFLLAAFVENFGAAGGFYRPIAWTSLYADLRVFGASPMALHATALGWHLGVSALVFVMVRALTPAAGSTWPALAAGAFFAAFPRRVEAVAWVSCRSDLLAALFACAAILLWISSRLPGGRVAAALVWGASLLSKETAALLPVVLLAATGGPWRARLWGLWPFGLVGGAAILLRRSVIGEWVGGSGAAVGVGQAIINGAKLAVYGLVPPLEALNRALLEPGPYRLTLLATAVLCSALGWAAWQRRDRPAVRVGILWVAATVLPLAAAGVAPSLSSSMNDRLLYLPGVGVAFVLAGLLERRRGFARLALAILLATAAWTWREAEQWRVGGQHTAAVVAALRDQLEGFGPCRVLVAAVPDNYRGAYMLRNGTVAALRMAGLDGRQAARVHVLSHYWLEDRASGPPSVTLTGDRTVGIAMADGQAAIVLAYGEAQQLARAETPMAWDRHARVPHATLHLHESAAILAAAEHPAFFRLVRGCP